MLQYLSADIICAEERTVFRECSSRETVSFEEQIMSKDKYPSIFSRHTPHGGYCVHYPSNVFRNSRGFENWRIYISYLPAGRSDRKPANNMFMFSFFSCSKLVLQITNCFFFTQLLSLNRLARRLLTIWKRSWQRASNSDSRQRRCIKKQIFSNYFVLVAFISPVKFSKVVFAVWNFVRSLKFYYKNNFCRSLLLKSLRHFSTVNWIAESEEIR